MNAIILDAISRYSTVIATKNIQISTNFIKDYYVKSDTYLLSIIVNNLISNALKYSNNNTILNIVITNKNGSVECAISDSGIGIPTIYWRK